jgi:hypothetical protein
MSAIDEITQAIGASTKLDTGTKTLLTEFLQTTGPALSAVAAESLNDLLQAIAGGDAGKAATIVSAALSPEQIVSVLDASQQQMQALLAKPAASTVAAQGVLEGLGNLAMSLVAKLIISAL